MPHLGALERSVMDVLWRPASRPMSVRDVLEALTDRDLAYTTILTVLDRLAKKGFAARVLDGRAWSYTAAVSREWIAQAAIRDILADPLLDRPTMAALLQDLTVDPEK